MFEEKKEGWAILSFFPLAGLLERYTLIISILPVPISKILSGT